MATGDSREVDNLRVTPVAASDEGVVLQLAGELDLSTVPIFVDALDEVIDGDRAKIELDLSQLSFMDSSGVGAYVTAYRKAQAKGSHLWIGQRSGLVERVLQLSGVEEALAQEAAAHDS